MQKLMKALLSEQKLGNLLFSLSRMSVESLLAVADSSLALSDWPKLGAWLKERGSKEAPLSAQGVRTGNVWPYAVREAGALQSWRRAQSSKSLSFARTQRRGGQAR